MNNYVTNLDAALEKHPEADPGNVQELLANIESVPVDIRTAVSASSQRSRKPNGA
jgi:superoxide dismutase, Fe-Mn family